jgi:hypothetical protein
MYQSLPALRLEELDAQSAELLPTRDTLCQFACINVAAVVGVNLAFAINAASPHAHAAALAHQAIVSAQHIH